MSEHEHNSDQKLIRVKIKRQERPEAVARWEEFDVPYKENLNIISVLNHIAAHPTTVEGRKTTTPCWDQACLEEVCGSCTMLVNGKVCQACSTLVDKIWDGHSAITLEPMTKFPVVRDLTVDRARMFKDLKRIQGWVPIDNTYALGPGPTETPAEQDTRYALSRCMTCGCCLEACPQYTLDNDFVGAMTISMTRYFNMHKTGAELADERLDVMEEAGGISDCGNAQNCVKVCPKEIPLTESIGDIGRATTVHSIKKFFTGK